MVSPRVCFSPVLDARVRFELSAFELLLLKICCLQSEPRNVPETSSNYDLSTLMPKYVSLMLVIR